MQVSHEQHTWSKKTHYMNKYVISVFLFLSIVSPKSNFSECYQVIILLISP